MNRNKRKTKRLIIDINKNQIQGKENNFKMTNK